MDYEAQISKEHYRRLNDYRNSKEYQEYAADVGCDVPEGDLPSLLNDRWEINEEIYWHFLEMLPPMGQKNGSFYMCEYTFDNITSKFTQEGDKYFCEFARYGRG